MKYLFQSIIILCCSLTLSCSNFLDIKPVHSMMPKSLDDFEAVLLGGYPRTDFFFRTEMLTDNVYVNFNSDSQPSQDNERWFTFSSSLVAPGTLTDPIWGRLYKSIFYANSVLDFLKTYKTTPEQQQQYEQIRGEALALRAYCYFYLINFYADVYSEENLNLPGVPMPLTAEDINENANNNVREPIGFVWQQILRDVEEASKLLSNKRIADRYRFSYQILQLFRARIDLMMGEYESASAFANRVIENYPLADLSELEERMQKNEGIKATLAYNFGFVDTQLNRELMFFTGGKGNSNLFSYTTGAMKPVEDLLALTKRYGELTDYRQFVYDSFEDNPVESLKTGKTVYKMYANQDLLWYFVGFKASEAYLIYAEAQARLGNGANALSSINKILASRMRKEHVVQLKTADFKNDTEIINRVLEERRLELAFDAGLRFMDLRRLGKPKIEHIYKDAQIFTLEQGDPRYLMQIPPSEIENSPDMPLNPR